MWDKHYIGLKLTGFQDKGETRPVSRVTLQVDDERVFTAGDDTGLELTASCPHGTQAMAEAILKQMKGYRYRMYAAEAASLDPAAELGDGITAGGVYSVLSRLSEDGSGYPSAEAPGEAELEDEFPTAGPLTQAVSQTNRKIAETRSSITKTAEEIRLEVTRGDNANASLISQTAESIRLEVAEGLNGVKGELSLKVGRDENDQIVSMLNASADQINIKGNRITISSTNFSVTADGTITAKAGVIGNSKSDGWNIGAKAIYNGTNSMTSTALGTYIGTDGIRQYASGSKFVNIQNGILTAQGVNISGEITATSGQLGGWKLTSTQLYNGDISENTSGNLGMSTADFTRTVAGTERKKLRFAIGSNFGVSNTGVLYAASADITGKFTATSGEIGGWTINSNSISYKSEDGLSVVRLSPIGAQSDNSVFRVATKETSSSSWKYPFRVYGDGSVTATKVTITGKVTANSESSIAGKLNDVTGSVNGITGSVDKVTGSVSSLTGSLSSATLGSCSLGGTSLTTGNGNAYFAAESHGAARVYGSMSANLVGGTAILRVGSPTRMTGSFTVSQDFTCEGTKNRVIKTAHFGERLLDAYETPMPIFADHGLAALDETGVCYITIDPVFAETVNKNYIPAVFLTKYGEGDIWVENVGHDMAVVQGTPGLRFSWETRYAQANAYTERLRAMGFDQPDLSGESDFDGESNIDLEHSSIDYAQKAYEYYTNFERSITA